MYNSIRIRAQRYVGYLLYIIYYQYRYNIIVHLVLALFRTEYVWRAILYFPFLFSGRGRSACAGTTLIFYFVPSSIDAVSIFHTKLYIRTYVRTTLSLNIGIIRILIFNQSVYYIQGQSWYITCFFSGRGEVIFCFG